MPDVAARNQVVTGADGDAEDVRHLTHSEVWRQVERDDGLGIAHDFGSFHHPSRSPQARLHTCRNGAALAARLALSVNTCPHAAQVQVPSGWWACWVAAMPVSSCIGKLKQDVGVTRTVGTAPTG